MYIKDQGKIDAFAMDFVAKNPGIVNSFAYKVYGDTKKLSTDAMIEILKSNISIAYDSFIRLNHNPDYLNKYIYACIKNNIKTILFDGKKNIYICPGCKSLDRISVVIATSTHLECKICIDSLNNEGVEKTIATAFAQHSRKGFRCKNCSRFIPASFEKNGIINCPYKRCSFSGQTIFLKDMRHPSMRGCLETPTDLPFINRKEGQLEAEVMVKDSMREHIQILNTCIDQQINALRDKSDTHTYAQKLAMYEAFRTILEIYPDDSISYLILMNRDLKIQYRIFQEFISKLELKLPYTYTKYHIHHKVENLLDPDVGIFDGESKFIAEVHNGEIDNNTEEVYTTNTGTKYSRFFIGKLIDVIDTNNKSLISHVKHYSFHKIALNNVVSGTEVLVKHWRIIPHYQMGAMVHLNRIRRAIVDRAYFMLNGKKRVIK